MYRGLPPAPPTSKAPPPREGLDPAWLVALTLGAFMAAWGWSLLGVLGAVVFGPLAFVIAATYTRRYARWQRARALAAAHAFARRVESAGSEAGVASPVRVAEAAEEPLDDADAEADERARR